jgi:hypothetical protein
MLSDRDLGRDDGGAQPVDGAHEHHAVGAPSYAPKFERRWNLLARPAGPSWHVDETWVKIRGLWVSLYRAVDSQGIVVDFRLGATCVEPSTLHIQK